MAQVTLHPTHILPECNRPQLNHVSSSASIPIINLADYIDETSYASSELVQQISQACEQYGFFQIINHGIPEQLCAKMLSEATKVFQHPEHIKAQLHSDDPLKNVRFTNYYLQVDGGQERVNMLSECFLHPWNPTTDVTSVLPQYLASYGEVVNDYAKEAAALLGRLLSLISQGLGLKNDCMKMSIGKEPRWRAQANYYPPSPDPELTLGLAVHTDFNAITILLQSQGASGLQVIKDDKWIAVHPVPNSLVINIGDQIQVLSNGRYKSVHHRAVSNKVMRVSLAMFYGPALDTVIGPIEELIDDEHPPVYHNYKMSEFLEEFSRQKGKRRMVKEAFEVKKVQPTEE